MFDIFCASMGLGRQMVKELDLRLTLGMAESLHLVSNHGEGVSGSNLGQTQKSPPLGVWLLLVKTVTAPVRHSSEVNQRPKNVLLWHIL